MMTTGTGIVFFSLVFYLFQLMDFVLFRFHLDFKRTGRVRVGGSDKNRSKRCKMRRLGPTYVFFSFVFFVTNYYIIGSTYRFEMGKGP